MTAPQQIVERALATSSTSGCVAIVDEVHTHHLRWAENAITAVGADRSRRLTVIALNERTDGAAVGSVARHGPLDRATIEDVVRQAEAAARSGPATGTAHPLPASPCLGDWDAPSAQPPPQVLHPVAADLAESLARARARRLHQYGYAEHRAASCYLGTSTGVRSRHDQLGALLEKTVKNADRSASAWHGANAVDFTGLDTAAVDADLDTRLGWSARRVELPPGRYPVVLEPSAVAELMQHLYSAAGADGALGGHSVFSRSGGTAAGERLTGFPLTIASDPAAPGMECAPFFVARASSGAASVFDNGLPLARTRWLDDGVLGSLVQTRDSAERTGLPVTPEIGNLLVHAPETAGSLTELVAGVERGLLISCLWYLRDLDPRSLLLTGLTRDGVHLVERGEIVGATNNFRFNESPVGLLPRITGSGPTGPALVREPSTVQLPTAAPPLRVEDFTMSSVSGLS
ncbi:metallopeptidase TldD-related protein [Saccharopolyspora sp. CA-218241]|uniref:metallopeptidase TldD-related protein n=1 Tax=Saccharopolyspora sp. CA-218241 TaxID=3240027 RepID=UPI003D951B65